ncbi:MAG: peptidoglycan DD-metalloendopeptidase family protein [Thermaerobacter sp.]|nr:peptidoglycan DD-metalloendopeptidase family protein [Thermaerobacter sp.]
MRRRAGASFALVASLTLIASFIPSEAHAETLQQAQQQLKQIQDQLTRDKQLLQQTQSSLASERATIASVHQNLDQTTAQLSQALNWEATLGRRIGFKQKEVATTQAKLSHDQAVVGSALRAIEQEGPGGYLNVLLGAQSFSDFEVRLGLLGKIIAADVSVIHTVQTAEKLLLEEKQALAAERSQYAHVAAMRRQEQSALQTQLTYQRQAIAQLDASYSKQQSAVHSDEGNSQEIEQIIQSLSSHGTGSGVRGVHFIWPVVGPITSPFGWRLDPVMHQWWIHTGIDIGVPYGTPIHAAATGKVIVAQWLNGYGYTIIIDDGVGISNLYAHQERFAVHVGQQVQQGQVIGYAGATGWATGPHLHFEVRIDGKPVNPAPYMPPMP